MAPRPPGRLLGLACLLATAPCQDTCTGAERSEVCPNEEESSMVQGVRREAIPIRSDNDRKHSLSTLMESAGLMLKNGATPDVINFTLEVLHEIAVVIEPAIENASRVDQELVENTYAQFNSVLNELETENLRIHALQSERVQQSTDHKHCRDQEATRCDEKITCDYHLWDLWQLFILEERELRSIQGTIDGHFCTPDTNGTTHSFRVTAAPFMQSFLAQKIEVDNAKTDFNGHRPECQRLFTALDDKTEDCDAKQLTLEHTACEHAVEVRRIRNQFACSWAEAVAAYDRVREDVPPNVIDRITEWRTLQVVECLLNRTAARNGRPCDESTEESRTEFTFCEHVRTNVDVTWLEIEFPDVPLLPPACLDHNSVVGQCYPGMPSYPCQEPYTEHEYSDLPDVPQPEFSHTNSHCNFRPNCQHCLEMETDLPEMCSLSGPLGPGGVVPHTGTYCGALPQLTNAVWVDGTMEYRCEDGFSFDGLALTSELVLEAECLSNGLYINVHHCMPIDDCVGHSCGAFGTCVDQHMDYTCQCVSVFEMNTDTTTGEKICGNIDDCHGHLCGSAGVCVDLLNDYECECANGWSQQVSEGNMKTCERVECGNVPEVDNVVSMSASGLFPWSRSKAVFEDEVEYTCANGYSTNGQLDGPRSFYITCQANEQYSAPQQCLPISCGAPEEEAGAIPESTAPVHFGGSAVYECPNGHEPEYFSRTCLESGHFSPPIACEPRPCGVAPVLTSASPTAGAQQHFFFGQSAEYHCADGYSTDPANPSASHFTVECGAEGWATSIGGCLPVTCEVVYDESHDTTWLSTTWVFDGLDNFALCHDDYSVDGTAAGHKFFFGTCGANGVAQLASCLPITCPAASLMDAPNAAVQEHRDYTVGNRATYTCNEGHAVALTGATTFEVECSNGGTFSAMSTCRNIDDCAGHSCGSNGRCVDGINDYSCDCESGFEQTVIAGEKMCGNINDCGPNYCGEHGACHDLVNGFDCECDTGYELQGQGDDRLCVAKVCPIPAMDNIIVLSTELAFPLTLIIECEAGHVIQNNQDSFEVGCSPNGEIMSGGSTTLPQCAPKVCGHPPDVLAEHREERAYHFGETAVSVCHGGEVQITHECRADGQFHATSHFTTCQNSCGNPSVPAHAHRSDGTGAVAHPNSASYTCNDGYTSQASLSQACRATGVFEALTGGCVPVVCHRPAAPANWEWVTQNALNFESPAHLRCASGYTSTQAAANGHFQIDCHSDGQISQLPSACQGQTYTLSGRITDAMNGAGVGSATLVINGQTTTTNAQGHYSVALPEGQHTYSLSANNFITASGSVTMSGGTSHFISMSPTLAADAWRIVLNWGRDPWGQSPRDLDSHLEFAGIDSWLCPEMYYGRRVATCAGVRAELDVDTTWQQYGDYQRPETTTLSNVNSCQSGRSCRWVYKVKNWSGPYGDHGWQQSDARVTLYNGDRLVREFSVNANDGVTYLGSSGSWWWSQDYKWSVFSIDANGFQECSNADCD